MTPEAASIEIRRDLRPLGDNLRAYKVILDDEVVDKVLPGELCVVHVTPGRHEIFLKSDWARSDKIPVTLTAGQVARFICTPRANPLTAPYWATVGRNRYIKMELAQL
jgi:hypothetical protein